MIGKTILHYKILDKLGEGGMGVVYLAEDTKLKRNAAIKFLPHYISSNEEERKRFEIEAQAAASLNHPNICTIYSIEEAEDNVFIAMEYIDGKELKSLVEKHGNESLQLNEIINYAIQIAEGLEAAHKKGIVHRDIKSQNIMITGEGKVKIMDFGLAKIGEGAQVTKFGSTVGTAAFMSPEQARGDEVDYRTDIWSFGVVLYEMLTGGLPFKGTYNQAVIYSILNEEIKLPDKINPELSDFYERVIEKCLKKDKKDRYENFSGIIKDLQSLKAGKRKDHEEISLPERNKAKRNYLIAYTLSALIILVTGIFIFMKFSGINNANEIKSPNLNSPKRLAVLPFTNIKNDKENDYLGFALADQVIGSLSYIKNILVRPSSTVRKYINTNINPSGLGRELNVEFILTGNYLKESDMVRLNLELVDVRSNEIIWRNDFDVTYKNTFTLQDIVSEKVVSGLKVQFTNEEKHSDIPQNPLAYEYFLKGVSYPLTNEANNVAADMLKKAVELDPSYAPAYSELGFRLQMLSEYDLNSRDKLKDAEESYLKALSLDKNLLTALGNLSSLYTEIGKTIEAAGLIKQALNINSNNANAHFWLGYIYRYTGLLKESVQEMETALRMDPGNPRFRTIGTTYLYMNKYDEAVKGFLLDKSSPSTYSWLGIVYFRMNNIELAKKYLSESISMDSNSSTGLWSAALLEYIKGNKEKGFRLLKTLENSETYDGEQFFNYANLYSLYDKKNDCLRTLRKAVDAGFYCYPLFNNDVFLDNVRKEPEFKELLSLTKEKSDQFRKKIFEM